MMGEIMRPVVLFVVGIFALEMVLLYFVFGGARFLTALDGPVHPPKELVAQARRARRLKRVD